jgi:hypothetical protein
VQFSASVAAAATTSAALTASTNVLANGVMQLMTWLKIKMAVGVVGVALIAGGGLAGATRLDQDGITPTDILKRSQQKYSSLSSYSDTWKAVAYRGTNELASDSTHSNRLMLGRPLLYRIESISDANPSASSAIWSAGNDFWSMFAGEYRKERVLATNYLPEFHALFPAAPIACAFFSKPDWDSLPALAQSKDLVRLADEVIEGVDCHAVSGTTWAPVFHIHTTLWIGKADFLIRQMRFVWITDDLRGRLAGPPGLSSNARRITNTVIETRSDIVLNATLSPNDFMRPLPTNTGPAFLHHTLYDTDGGQMNPSMIDLESGMMFSSWALERPFSSTFQDGLRRMRQEGIDLCGDSSGKTFSGFDMIIVPAERAFDLVTSETTAFDRRLRGQAEPQVNVTVQDVPATYLFKTREGSRGVLEVIRFSANLESMDFRYRLLQPARTKIETVATPSSASGTPIAVRAFDRLYEFEMSSSDKRFLDLDTGEFAAAHPPGDLFWPLGESDLQARAGMNMSAVAVTPEKWATASANEVLERLRTEPAQKQVRIGGSASKLEPVSKQTWFFRTSEGGVGVLQMLPHNARTDSVMVRWKLALPRTGERAVPTNK